jgi:hypothetical protein
VNGTDASAAAAAAAAANVTTTLTRTELPGIADVSLIHFWTLSGLRPATDYTLSVVVFNKAGASAASPPTEVSGNVSPYNCTFSTCAYNSPIHNIKTFATIRSFTS